jgi:hypothetical protein
MTSMASVDRAVVRMFICRTGYGSVGNTDPDGRGLELTVFGPGNVRRAQAFPDAMSLVEYQVQFERQLLSNGTQCCRSVSAVAGL